MKVAICGYGAGNVRSVEAAFERLRAEPIVTSDPAEVAGADVAVLPGVGAARSAIRRLRSSGVAESIGLRVAEGRPTLGICLGLQLALEESDEGGVVRTLGLVPGRAVRLNGPRVPRMGWAVVEPPGEAFYFAHSFAASTPAATATSEGTVAAIRWGSFVGVQFHPEKSGPAGARYLDGYLRDVIG